MSDKTIVMTMKQQQTIILKLIITPDPKGSLIDRQKTTKIIQCIYIWYLNTVLVKVITIPKGIINIYLYISTIKKKKMYLIWTIWNRKGSFS